MKTLLMKILVVASLFLGMQLSASAISEYISGTGGKEIKPDGTVTYCPTSQPSSICAKIETETSGDPIYTDLLKIYGSTGVVIATHKVNLISIGTGNESITVEDGGPN